MRKCKHLPTHSLFRPCLEVSGHLHSSTAVHTSDEASRYPISRGLGALRLRVRHNAVEKGDTL
jgi:hypothetical protein